MAWQKKWDHLRPYKQVICINNKGSKLLKRGMRGVIKETETCYLIQFYSGAANWYSKERFIDKPEPKIEIIPELEKTLNKLI